MDDHPDVREVNAIDDYFFFFGGIRREEDPASIVNPKDGYRFNREVRDARARK